MLWAVFLLRGQVTCPASKERWTETCTVRARAVKWAVEGYSSMTMTQTHGQGNKGASQEEAHYSPGVAEPVS